MLVVGVSGINDDCVGNKLVVKRVDFDISSQSSTLISANPASEPRHYSEHELEGFRITGSVVAYWHNINLGNFYKKLKSLLTEL